MNALVMAPVEWSAMQDIDEIEPIGAHDTDCLAELRDVLKKHDKLERFGVTLLHTHFEIGDDEIMLETLDVANRVLTTTPVKADGVANKIATVLALREGDPTTMSWCRKYCMRWFLGHSREHNKAR